MIVFVDGSLASGKTTYAKRLRKKLGYKLIQYDKYYNSMKNKLKNKDEENIRSKVAKKLLKKNEKYPDLIFDNAVIKRDEKMPHIKRYLIYASPKILIKHMKKMIKKSIPVPIKEILESFADMYEKSDKKEEAIDTLTKKNLMKIISYDENVFKMMFKTENDFKEYMNKIYDKIGFKRKEKKIYIKPRYKYDEIITANQKLV